MTTRCSTRTRFLAAVFAVAAAFFVLTFRPANTDAGTRDESLKPTQGKHHVTYHRTYSEKRPNGTWDERTQVESVTITFEVAEEPFLDGPMEMRTSDLDQIGKALKKIGDPWKADPRDMVALGRLAERAVQGKYRWKQYKVVSYSAKAQQLRRQSKGQNVGVGYVKDWSAHAWGTIESIELVGKGLPDFMRPACLCLKVDSETQEVVEVHLPVFDIKIRWKGEERGTVNTGSKVKHYRDAIDLHHSGLPGQMRSLETVTVGGNYVSGSAREVDEYKGEISQGRTVKTSNWWIGEPFVLQIQHKVDGAWEDITKPRKGRWIAKERVPRLVTIGEKVELRAVVLPEEQEPAHGQWTIPGRRIEGFVVEGGPSGFERGRVDELEDKELTEPRVKFHWWDEGQNLTVKYSATVNGKQLQAEADFVVNEPKIKQRAEVPDGEFRIETLPDAKEHLFYWADGKHTVTFTHDPLPPEFPGKTQYVQLVHTSGFNRRHKDALDPCLKLDAEGLDEDYPYSSNSRTTDNPEVRVNLELDLVVSVKNDYRMYLMFRPEKEGAIFVPLRVTKWNWRGVAERANLLDDFDLRGSKMSNNLRDEEAQEYPQWDRVVREGDKWTPCGENGG